LGDFGDDIAMPLATMMIEIVSLITGCAVSQHCCKGNKRSHFQGLPCSSGNSEPILKKNYGQLITWLLFLQAIQNGSPCKSDWNLTHDDLALDDFCCFFFVCGDSYRLYTVLLTGKFFDLLCFY